MRRTISFSEEIDKINDVFPVVLYCAKCDRLRLMKIERGSIGIGPATEETLFPIADKLLSLNVHIAS